MHTEFLMGNEAIAVGALAAGVQVVAGYPGTPSTEVLETVAKRKPDDVYVERRRPFAQSGDLEGGELFAGYARLDLPVVALSALVALVSLLIVVVRTARGTLLLAVLLLALLFGTRFGLLGGIFCHLGGTARFLPGCVR